MAKHPLYSLERHLQTIESDFRDRPKTHRKRGPSDQGSNAEDRAHQQLDADLAMQALARDGDEDLRVPPVFSVLKRRSLVRTRRSYYLEIHANSEVVSRVLHKGHDDSHLTIPHLQLQKKTCSGLFLLLLQPFRSELPKAPKCRHPQYVRAPFVGFLVKTPYIEAVLYPS